jgi:hypothetical protein
LSVGAAMSMYGGARMIKAASPTPVKQRATASE